METEVEDALTVDTGHLVAFENSLQYTITKAGISWLQSWLAGEGFVMNFTGRGRILTQSHNPKEFGVRLGPPSSSSKVVVKTMKYQIICDPTYSAVEVNLACGRAICRRIGRHGMDDREHADGNLHAWRLHGRHETQTAGR